MYSLGNVFYYLLTNGVKPFADMTSKEALNQVGDGIKPKIQNPQILKSTHPFHDNVIRAMKACWVHSSTKRPDARKIRHYLNVTLQDSLSSSSWCPFATCQNSHLCRPCEQQFLIIIATGRSASTTLQNMLGSLPNIRMSGENNNALGALKRMINQVDKNPNYQDGASAANHGAWSHNPVPPGAHACVAQHFVQTINPPLYNETADDNSTIVGFKTIRFLDSISDETNDKDIVQFVQEMFPCARILVNIRSDTESQYASIKTKRGLNRLVPSRKGLADMTSRLRHVAKMFNSQSFLLDSTEWTRNLTKLNEVVDWLGFDATCHFQELLEFNTNGYRGGKTDLDAIHPNCRFVG